jgi:hypothetical protein
MINGVRKSRKWAGLTLGLYLTGCGGSVFDQSFVGQPLERYFEAQSFEISMEGDGKTYEGVLTRRMKDGYTVTVDGLMWNTKDAKENYPIALELARRASGGTFYFDGETLPPEFKSYQNNLEYSLRSFNRISGQVRRDGSRGETARFEVVALDPGRP